MRSIVWCGSLLAAACVVSLSFVACGGGDEFQPSCSGGECTTPDAATEKDGGGQEGGSNDGGTTDATPCIPAAGTDDPDDGFQDTNCDGIDGDLTAAIFVAPSGDDASDGSMQNPVQTLTHAVAKAAAAGKDVYACNATYSESLVVETTVRVFGGYDCEDSWRRTTERAVVAPGVGRPLLVRNASAVLFDRVDFVAADGVGPGESSIAALVRDSSDVRFNRVSFDAGRGADGASGTAGIAATTPAPSGANGASVSVSPCPASSTPTGQCAATAKGGSGDTYYKCGTSVTLGGPGGAGGNVKLGVAAKPGGSGFIAGAKGGQLTFPGNPGTPGVAGTVGKPGSAFGAIVDGEYVASNSGTDGTEGTLGESGGGGSGGLSFLDCADTFHCYQVGSGGGQGGTAGCGGEGGRGGGGGGASISLVVIDSDVSLHWSVARTAGGGAGGQPGAGAPGQAGGQPGKGGSHPYSPSLATGKPGGAGGNGGPGGAGGPGGGGPSVAVLVVGPKPTTEATTFETGPGGPGASGAAGGDGAPGQSGDLVVLDPK